MKIPLGAQHGVPAFHHAEAEKITPTLTMGLGPTL